MNRLNDQYPGLHHRDPPENPDPRRMFIMRRSGYMSDVPSKRMTSRRMLTLNKERMEWNGEKKNLAGTQARIHDFV